MEPLMAATFDSLPVQRIFVDARKHAYTPLTPSQNASACGGDTWPRYIALLRSGMPNWVLNKCRPERPRGVWWEMVTQIATVAGRPPPLCRARARVTPSLLLQHPLACMHALPESILAL